MLKLKSLKIGKWAGFECSLIDSNNKTLIVSKLEESYSNLERLLQDNSIGEMNINLLIDLLEHEVHTTGS
ncbi:hypothetical protein AWH56_26860 [Anaerobacillus isosaccharinicus]|uniref:Uncharacterized protein n=1 Tax=Anaerobacillus isosaccharinicus TaxID=1532552 RepID=A0AC62A4P1_9BACI|nr:hypothetical protein [Anaerobacillus isosaccharinicus]